MKLIYFPAPTIVSILPAQINSSASITVCGTGFGTNATQIASAFSITTSPVTTFSSTTITTPNTCFSVIVQSTYVGTVNSLTLALPTGSVTVTSPFILNSMFLSSCAIVSFSLLIAVYCPPNTHFNGASDCVCSTLNGTSCPGNYKYDVKFYSSK